MQRRHGGGEGPRGPERHRTEEEPVETVRNREDGTRRRAGPLFPKGVRSERARGWRPGVDGEIDLTTTDDLSSLHAQIDLALALNAGRRDDVFKVAVKSVLDVGGDSG